MRQIKKARIIWRLSMGALWDHLITRHPPDHTYNYTHFHTYTFYFKHFDQPHCRGKVLLLMFDRPMGALQLLAPGCYIESERIEISKPSTYRSRAEKKVRKLRRAIENPFLQNLAILANRLDHPLPPQRLVTPHQKKLMFILHFRLF